MNFYIFNCSFILFHIIFLQILDRLKLCRIYIYSRTQPNKALRTKTRHSIATNKISLDTIFSTNIRKTLWHLAFVTNPTHCAIESDRSVDSHNRSTHSRRSLCLKTPLLFRRYHNERTKWFIPFRIAPFDE